jgi:hypothetical protein
VVSVSYSQNVERSDRLHQSVDVAIQDALVDHENPLALSFYLWVIKKNRHSVVNLGNLTSWGMAQVNRVFIDRHIGRRRDEEVASASLAAIALGESPEFAPFREGVRAGIESLLREEIEVGNLIPLKRAPYGILLLAAAQATGIDQAHWQPAVERTVATVLEALPGGRLFGLVFAAQLVRSLNDQKLAASLENVATDILAGDGIDFEDQAYVLQALWQLREGTKPGESLMSVTEHLLKKVPVWQYLMNGDEHLPPAGDGRAVIYISHLYRAALLDVVLQYQARFTSRRAEQLDERYRAHPSLNRAAFGFYVLSLLLLWSVTGYYLVTRADDARRYWILAEFAPMTPFAAVFYLAVVLLATYVLIVTFMVMPTMYSVLVKWRIGSDQRIRDLVRPRLWKATKLWFAVIVIAVLLDVMTNLIAPTVKHLLGGW